MQDLLNLVRGSDISSLFVQLIIMAAGTTIMLSFFMGGWSLIGVRCVRIVSYRRLLLSMITVSVWAIFCLHIVCYFGSGRRLGALFLFIYMITAITLNHIVDGGRAIVDLKQGGFYSFRGANIVTTASFVPTFLLMGLYFKD